jgi:hypothetical protein
MMSLPAVTEQCIRGEGGLSEPARSTLWVCAVCCLEVQQPTSAG